MNILKKKISKVISTISIFVLGIFLLIPSEIFAQQNPPSKIPSPYKDTNLTLVGFIEFILEKIVLPVGSIIAVIFLVYAGFLFVTAQGNETKLEKAKKTLLWTIVGIAVLLGSVVISKGIQSTICQIAPNIPNFCP